jgi:aryl-alcohol dehydrogenase-like predicted oxidoreductase
LQAEYSAFETLHETDGLIDAARELDIAYVAYSPLGHGWLVDDFPYQSPDDFADNDFRRGCMYSFNQTDPVVGMTDISQHPSSRERTSITIRRSSRRSRSLQPGKKSK